MPRFRIDAAPTSKRRFVLPAHERSTAPEPLPELGEPVTAPSWGVGLGRETYRRPVQPKRTPERPAEAQTDARGLFTVRAPVGPRKGRTVLDFVAADDSAMPAFLGTIQLQIDAESVDLSRLSGGVLTLALDHDVSQLMGRITEATIHPGRLDMEAEVGDTPIARSAMMEIGGLMRAGFSPGFLIHKVRILDEGDDSYDPDEYMQIVCEKWEPYEISSTAIPRNPNAKLRGKASMTTNEIMDAPELVSTSDLIGLSLMAGRAVLRGEGGSESQRAKLKEFYAAFETGIENGLSRDVAAQAAKAVAGI